MRRLLRRLGAFYEKHALAIDLGLITAGAAAVKRRLEDVHGRLDALEERGLVPLDDLVTVRDVAKIDRRVWVLEGEPGPDPAAVWEEPAPAGDAEPEEEAPAAVEQPGEE